jgi:hypothetical protein
MFQIANLHRNQRIKDPPVNGHVKKIQNWIWNWEYNKFTRVNIHIGYNIFCWKLSLVEISKIEYETENTINLQV